MLDQAGAEPNLLYQNREAVTEDRRLRQSDHEKTLRAILASPEAKQAQDVLDKAEAALVLSGTDGLSEGSDRVGLRQSQEPGPRCASIRE